MSVGGVERRVQPRLPASLLVTYASESLGLTGIATDLSPAGLFVETDILDTVGTQAFLRLTDGASGRVEAVGQVVRAVADGHDGMAGMGIAFLELDPTAVFWIRRYCNTFSTSLRVALAGADSASLAQASGAVESVGGRPLCLGPEVLSVAAVARLAPHVVIVGTDAPELDGLRVAEALAADSALASAMILIAGEGDPAALEATARELGLAGALAWHDDRALLRAIDEASRRLGRGPLVSAGGRFWLN